MDEEKSPSSPEGFPNQFPLEETPGESTAGGSSHGDSSSSEEPLSGQTYGQKSLRKLYKSSSDRIIDGVCGGIAEYLGIDSSVVRLLLVALSILSLGAGIIFYIIAMLVVPAEPMSAEVQSSSGETKKVSNAGNTITLVIGIVIVIIGISLLFGYYNIFSITSTWHYFGRLVLPIVLILIGGALLLGRERREKEHSETQGESLHVQGILRTGVERKKLVRSVHDKKIAGVCGGLAEYFAVDPTIVRLAYVLLTFASFGLALILYIVCAFTIPKEVNS